MQRKNKSQPRKHKTPFVGLFCLGKTKHFGGRLGRNIIRKEFDSKWK